MFSGEDSDELDLTDKFKLPTLNDLDFSSFNHQNDDEED